MKRALWRFRMVLWIVGFACLTWFLVVYTPWHTLFPPDYDKYAVAGGPLVKAVYAYHNDKGLWPVSEYELVPKYIAAIPKDWAYEVRDGWPRVALPVRTDVWVDYDFDPAERHWRAWGQFLTERRLSVSQEVPPEPPMTEERANRVLAEYDRRIRMTSDEPESWQGKGGFLYELGRTAELRAYLERTVEDRPLFYWPRMALAVLEWQQVTKDKHPECIGDPFRFLPPKEEAAATATATAPATGPVSVPAPTTATTPATATASAPATAAGRPPQAPPVTAGEHFVAWVVDHPSFTRYFYVYSYARTVGNEPAAIRAVELAMRRTVQSGAEDPKSSYYYLFRMARFTYEAKQYSLCLQICTEWADLDQAERRGHAKGNRAYLPLAAAANLAIGDFERAESLAQRAIIADDQGPRLWAQNLVSLSRAADSKDQKFVYIPDPDGKLKEYDVFERPER